MNNNRADIIIAKESAITNDFLRNIDFVQSQGMSEMISDLNEIVDNIETSNVIALEGYVGLGKDMKLLTDIMMQGFIDQTKVLTNIQGILGQTADNILKYGELAAKKPQEEQSKTESNIKSPDTENTKKPKYGLEGIADLFDTITKGGDAAQSLGKGMIMLAGGVIAFGAALLIVNPVIAAEMLISSILIGKTMDIYGNIATKYDFEKIDDSLAILGGSIVLFGLAMLVSGPLYLVAAPGMAIAALSIVLFSKALSYVDSEQIENVSEALLFASAGIVVFGLAMYAISAMEFDLGNIAIVAGSMAIFGLITWVLGKGVSTLVEGSLAMIGMGLAVLGYTWMISKAMDLVGDWEAVLTNSLTLAESMALIGGSMFLLGMAAPFIIPGMLTLLGMGLSLYVYSNSLKAFQDLGLNENIGESLKKAISAPFEAFGSISVKDILKATVALPAFISLSMGLVALSNGIERIAEIDKKYNVDYGKIGTNISTLLLSTKDVFAEIGGEFKPKSLMGLLVGDDLGDTPVERGIASVRDLGNILVTLADGISKWSNMESNFPNLNIGKIGENVNSVLTVLKDVFAEIGADEGGGSYLKLIFGNDLGDTPVERGITSVRDLGSVLTTLADGISKWADLGKNFPNLNYETIVSNIKQVLSLTRDVFAEIGAEDGGFSFTDLLLGNDLGDTPVERGIASVRDLGSVLDTLATGILKWNDLNNLKDAKGNPIAFNKEQIVANLKDILTTIPAVFTDIGKESSSWWESSTDLEKGIDTVKDLSSGIAGIADTFGKFNAIKDPGGTMDAIAKSYERIAKAVNSMKVANVVKLTDLFKAHKLILDAPKASDDALNALIKNLLELLNKTYDPQTSSSFNAAPSINPVPNVTAIIPSKTTIGDQSLLSQILAEITNLSKSLNSEDQSVIVQKLNAINATLRTGTITVKPIKSIG